jgi:hypothetical protein
MSDGCTEAYRAGKRAESYEGRVSAIMNQDLDSLCRTFKVERSQDILGIADQVKEFRLSRERDFDSLTGQIHLYWRLGILIPGANYYSEHFKSESLEEIVTRCKAYLVWSNTSIGKRAIDEYLDH